jgi:hypothetical protein
VLDVPAVTEAQHVAKSNLAHLIPFGHSKASIDAPLFFSKTKRKEGCVVGLRNPPFDEVLVEKSKQIGGF